MSPRVRRSCVVRTPDSGSVTGANGAARSSGPSQPTSAAIGPLREHLDLVARGEGVGAGADQLLGTAAPRPREARHEGDPHQRVAPTGRFTARGRGGPRRRGPASRGRRARRTFARTGRPHARNSSRSSERSTVGVGLAGAAHPNVMVIGSADAKAWRVADDGDEERLVGDDGPPVEAHYVGPALQERELAAAALRERVSHWVPIQHGKAESNGTRRRRIPIMSPAPRGSDHRNTNGCAADSRR